MSLFAKQLEKDILLNGSYKAELARKCGVGKTYIGNICNGNIRYIPSEKLLLKLSEALPKANIKLWRKLIELDRLNKKCPMLAKELISCIDPDTDRTQLTLRDIKIITALVKQATKE